MVHGRMSILQSMFQKWKAQSTANIAYANEHKSLRECTSMHNLIKEIWEFWQDHCSWKPWSSKYAYQCKSRAYETQNTPARFCQVKCVSSCWQRWATALCLLNFSELWLQAWWWMWSTHSHLALAQSQCYQWDVLYVLKRSTTVKYCPEHRFLPNNNAEESTSFADWVRVYSWLHHLLLCVQCTYSLWLYHW